MIHLTFLDFIWKSIFASTVSSSMVIGLMLILYFFFQKNFSKKYLKWYFNLHSAFLLLAIFICSIIIVQMDPELVSGCFHQFVQTNGSFNLTRIIAGIYLSIFGILLLKDCLHVFATSKSIEKLPSIQTGEILKIIQDLKKILNIQSEPSLFASNKAESPFVWGIFRYKIIVTKELLNSKDIQKIRTILSHELTHIKDRDSFWIFLSHLSKRVFFFNPMVHYFANKHRRIVELAADEMAIQKCGITPNSLLTAIIEIAEQCSGKKSLVFQSNASQGFYEIKERMESMLNSKELRFNNLFPIFSSMSLLICLFVVATQAKTTVTDSKKFFERPEMICSQVKHEKIIEDWLRLKPSLNKCEMK